MIYIYTYKQIRCSVYLYIKLLTPDTFVVHVHIYENGGREVKLGSAFNKMIPTSTLYNITDFTNIQGKGSCFKLLLHISALKKAKIATLAGATAIRLACRQLAQRMLTSRNLALVALQ